MLRPFLLAVLGGLAFLLGTALLRPFVPWPEDAALDARMRDFREHADEYDLAFVGASTIWRSFDPRVVDARLAERGHPLRSINLSADNMHSVEAGHVVEEILAARPKRLRYLVFEVRPFDARQMLAHNEFTDRAVYWHAPGRFVDAVQRVLESPALPQEKLRLVWVHLQHAAWRLANLGQGEHVAKRLFASNADAQASTRALLAARGFKAIDPETDAGAREARQRFMDQLPRYRSWVSGLAAANAQPVAVVDAAPAVREQIERLRAASLTPVSVIPPITHGTPALYRLAERGQIPNVVGLNDPKRYPELYNLSNRYDELHLNAEGAAVASRIFADRLADLIEAQDGG